MRLQRDQKERAETAFEVADSRENLIHKEYLAELDHIHVESLQAWDRNFEELSGKTPHWGVIQLGPVEYVPERYPCGGLVNPFMHSMAQQNRRAIDQAAFQNQLNARASGQLGNMYGGLGGMMPAPGLQELFGMGRQIGLSQQQIKNLDRLTGREDS